MWKFELHSNFHVLIIKGNACGTGNAIFGCVCLFVQRYWRVIVTCRLELFWVDSLD